jgi:parallel beta-helix repeat protein
VNVQSFFQRGVGRKWKRAVFFAIFVWFGHAAVAGNFYAGTSPATVPWTNGIVPCEFTNTLSAAQKQTYLDGLREWELAANVKFVPHTNQSRWILFDYNTNGFDNVSTGYNPQIVSVASLSRAQVGHEMGHSFGFTHENIRPDQATYLTVLTNNIIPADLSFFVIDPTSVTNGPYDFESVMHLGHDFASIQPGVLDTQLAKPGYERYQNRMGNFALSPGDRAALRFLYGAPAVPLTNVVTTTADVGPGSLRAAMYYVADNPGAVVRFNIPNSDPGFSNGVFTIHLSGHLPPLAADGMIIDGSTQPGFANKPLIVVDGSQILPETFTSNSGLLIYSADNQIKNISFSGFNWNGLTLLYADATNNTIAGCWLGVDATGSNAAPNAYQGILFGPGPSRNIIGGTNALARNVLSGNAEYGIWMSDTNTTGNVIVGNYIGIDPGGVFAIPNGLGGIGIFTNSSGHFIGGTNAASRNVISGNVNAGIWLSGPGVSNIVVQGNYIGLNAAGTAAVSNRFAGIYVLNGARSNAILNNVISGNFQEGLRLSDAGTSGNVVQGNFCGTGPSGANAIPNGFAGVTIYSGASSNLIGGLVPAARNILSGNGAVGLAIGNAGTGGNVVQGNFMGVDASGAVKLANGTAAMYVTDGPENTLIGGTASGAGNVLSGNGSYGVYMGNATNNAIQGNVIGTMANGSSAMGNGFAGIYLFGTAQSNSVGLDLAGNGSSNHIAFNAGYGIVVVDPTTTGNTLRGNSIYSNSAIGINLFAPSDVYPGVTQNDLNDPDTGANRLQNFPVFTSASISSNVTILSGTLNSTPGRSFVLDFYRNFAPNPSGYGEGQFYVGSTMVTTDAAGNAIFGFGIVGNFSGQYFTATATDLTTGDTSEFSLAKIASAGNGAPRFSGAFTYDTNGFAVNLVSLESNRFYRIQASTNLLSWTDLTNVIPIAATNLVYTDAAGTNFALRFYRAVSP